MNKWLKRTLIVSAAVTAAGAVLLGAGVALGGSPSFYYDADGLHVKEKRTYNEVCTDCKSWYRVGKFRKEYA